MSKVANLIDEDSLYLLVEDQFLKPFRKIYSINKLEDVYTVTINDSLVRKFTDNISHFFSNIIGVLLESKHIDELPDGLKEKLEEVKEEFPKLLRFTDEQYQNISKAISQMAIVLECIVNEKTFLLPSIMSKKIPAEEIVRGINKFGSLIGYYNSIMHDKYFIEHLLEGWRQSPILTDRFDILKKTINSHIAKDYELSIPIFLIHIEAIFNEIFKNNKKNLKMEEKKKIIKNAILKDAKKSNMSEHFLKDSVLYLIADEVLKGFSENIDEASYPNRHTILHGKDLNYYKDELASTKCIILLDALTNARFKNYSIP